jgi:uncharacterized membrane protein YbhN (UPF0104 family)
VATPQLLGKRVGGALDTLGRADPHWLWVAGLAFAVSLVGSAGCWRSAIGLCGARTSLADATARYGAGSLVNTFVPARAGDAVRLALFSRLLPEEGRLATTGGAFVAVSAVRGAVLGALLVAGAVLGVVPLWPLLGAGALVAVADCLVQYPSGLRAGEPADAHRSAGAPAIQKYDVSRLSLTGDLQP